jgi:hypothetical protein
MAGLIKPAHHGVVRRRARPTLYGDASRQALIVLWEAPIASVESLKPLLRILCRRWSDGHLKLHEAIRAKVLAMSAATTGCYEHRARRRASRPRRVVPETRRRVRVRTR